MAKALFSCHACGASVRVDGRNRKEADRLAAWHQAQEHLCSDCEFEAHKQAAAEAATANRAEGLPELTGSEKQIVWAEQLRAGIVLSLEAEVEKVEPTEPNYGLLLQAHSRILSYQRASWWIDNRMMSPRAMLAEAGRKLMANPPPSINPVEIEARAEASVYPSSPILKSVTEIKLDGGVLSATYPGISPDTLRETVKALGLSWSGQCWQKTLGEQDENPADRIAELGHHLLATGIPVLIWDETLRAKAVAGDYQPLHPRWVTATSKLFYLHWPREDDLYTQARRLPGSKYQSPCVTVPASHWEEVAGFASIHDFRLSQSAADLIDAMENARLSALIAEVSQPKRAKPAPQRTSQAETTDGFTVADSLTDIA